MNDESSGPANVSPFAAGAVESLYADYVALVEDVTSNSPSALVALNRSYHKVVLIAAASNLEAQVKRIVKDVFERQGRKELSIFVEKAVMDRGYHALFDWKSEKATKFFASFGESCSQRFKSMLQEDGSLKQEHESFMKLGALRNQLVHQDYATFPLESTPKELIILYRRAVLFPQRFESIILEPASSEQ